MFSQKDIQQIQHKGLTLDEVNRQVKNLVKGFPPADITMPATPGKGIISLSEGEEKHYQDIYLNNAPDFTITRFIPASGAATRMFKSLYAALDKLELKSPEQQRKWLEKHKDIKQFFKKLEEYPFFEDLEGGKKKNPASILRELLEDEGLNYGHLPKGLIKFHKYSSEDRRTAFEEHIREAVKYCVNRKNEVKIHLTVSPDHLRDFERITDVLIPEIERETGIQINLSFSFQQAQTDTIALDMSNEPVRNTDGTLMFRPGGHGALIRNLDAIESDIIFVSNIDNVAPDRIKNIRVKYKQVLCGVLLQARAKIFYYLHQLNANEKMEKSRMDQMLTYLHEGLGIAVPDRVDTWDQPELRQWLISTMNRPIRVCGMVKNEGEPGGGPFYVRSESGEVSLQIVESSQIDFTNPEKALLVRESTHFNPVDLVCSTRDYLGKMFHLERYVDPNTGFIAEKSVEGKEIKALELPGLWNGSMARWLTLFVQVPVETFSPVKTVFDLIRKEHRI